VPAGESLVLPANAFSTALAYEVLGLSYYEAGALRLAAVAAVTADRLMEGLGLCARDYPR
jgi:hypothetical protein